MFPGSAVRIRGFLCSGPAWLRAASLLLARALRSLNVQHLMKAEGSVLWEPTTSLSTSTGTCNGCYSFKTQPKLFFPPLRHLLKITLQGPAHISVGGKTQIIDFSLPVSMSFWLQSGCCTHCWQCRCTSFPGFNPNKCHMDKNIR